MSIKAFVEKADAFVQVVQVINEHPISYHSLLSNTTLQFIPLPASKPRGALDQFFGVLFKVSQDPDIVIYPEHRPLLVPTINHFGGREGDPYMEQSGNTYGWERKRMNLSRLREAALGVSCISHLPRKKLLQASGTRPHKPLPATQERLPAIALVSPLQDCTSTRGRVRRDLPGDNRTFSAGVTRGWRRRGCWWGTAREVSGGQDSRRSLRCPSPVY